MKGKMMPKTITRLISSNEFCNQIADYMLLTAGAWSKIGALDYLEDEIKQLQQLIDQHHKNKTNARKP